MTRVITDPKEMYGFLCIPGIEVMNLVFACDDVVWISWKYGAQEDVTCLRHKNEVIGAYVTAGARIHLYRYLDRLQENAIDCNTDCVIYIQPKGDGHQLIETGDKFGDMTSELRPTRIISEFVYGGQKTYAYRVLDTGTGDPQTVCKVRGISLNYNSSKMVKFEVNRNKMGAILPTISSLVFRSPRVFKEHVT